MAKIYVGFCPLEGFVAATTKAGLSKLLGCSVDTVRRNLGVGRVEGIVSSDGRKVRSWDVAEVEVVKVGGRSGNGDPRFGGFLGMKGKDGRLVK